MLKKDKFEPNSDDGNLFPMVTFCFEGNEVSESTGDCVISCCLKQLNWD